MSIAVAQIALIFLPGMIWASLDAKYGSGTQSGQFAFTVKSFLFGVFSYAVLYVLYSLRPFAFTFPFDIEQGGDLTSFLDEIILSVPVSLSLSVCWLYGYTNKWVPRILQAIKATRRYGDEDIWTFTFNSDLAFKEYVHVRDQTKCVTFAGYVRGFSDHGTDRELLLSEVIVYQEDGAEISRAPFLYISLEKSDIWIEFPESSAKSEVAHADRADGESE